MEKKCQTVAIAAAIDLEFEIANLQNLRIYPGVF